MNTNLSPEQLEKRKSTNSKILKYGCLPIFIFLAVIVIIGSIYDSNKTNKEKEQIETPKLSKKDSIKLVRDTKITMALDLLENSIKENMNDPESYELVNKGYDIKDSVNNEVHIQIKFRGKNAFGAKVINVVDGVYNFKTDDLKVIPQ